MCFYIYLDSFTSTLLPISHLLHHLIPQVHWYLYPLYPYLQLHLCLCICIYIYNYTHFYIGLPTSFSYQYKQAFPVLHGSRDWLKVVAGEWRKDRHLDTEKLGSGGLGSLMVATATRSSACLLNIVEQGSEVITYSWTRNWDLLYTSESRSRKS